MRVGEHLMDTSSIGIYRGLQSTSRRHGVYIYSNNLTWLHSTEDSYISGPLHPSEHILSATALIWPPYVYPLMQPLRCGNITDRYVARLPHHLAKSRARIDIAIGERKVGSLFSSLPVHKYISRISLFISSCTGKYFKNQYKCASEVRQQTKHSSSSFPHINLLLSPSGLLTLLPP